MNRRASMVFAVAMGAALLCPALVAWAGSNQSTRVSSQATSSGYKAIENTIAAYRAALDGGDVVDLSGTGTAAIAEYPTGRFTNLEVHGRFSTTAATCVVTVARYNKVDSTLVLQSKTTLTLTADAAQVDGAGLFLSDPGYFDTGASNVVKILAADPSAGTIDLWVRSY